MTSIYENIFEEFNKKKCKLLTSKEEYDQIKNNSKSSNIKLNYIASCGHNHMVFYNVFKHRNTGIICSFCKNYENGKKKKEQIENGKLSKLHNIEQEFNFINQLKEIISKDFFIVKAFDGCNVDVIVKPKNILNNEWIGIQIKTTQKIRLTYSFHMNTYKNCLILLYCVENKNMWLIPENIICKQKKISIGVNKSKYNIYKVENIVNRLSELYINTNKFNFDLLNRPINIYQQREQSFRNYREEKIQFLNFIYDEMEGTVYDFKINNFKIQEKVASTNKNNGCIFQLCKNNGKINNKQNQVQYEINDNDFYWLNCDNKIFFFVIPEKNLIDREYIGKNTKKTLKITVKEPLHFKSNWLEPYMFNYETINEEENKIRLLKLLK